VEHTGGILNNGEYFYCEKARCTLRVSVCIQRQKANRKPKAFFSIPFPICQDCSQGAKNRAMSKPGVTAKPKRGPGDKSVECSEYASCLDLAAKKDWKSFNCEACAHHKKKPGNAKPMTDEKEENGRLCDCGKPTISPNCPYCPSCMAKKSNEARAVKQKAEKRAAEKPSGGRKVEEATHDMPKQEKPPARPSTALAIDFGKYADVLEQVKRRAEEEIRPIDLQVIFMLKQGLQAFVEEG
jgi:hypothetical protein